MKLDEIPISVWAFLVGQMGLFLYGWGGLKQRVKTLEKDSTERDETIKSIFSKVNQTAIDVATIKGMLGTRKEDKVKL